MAKRVGLTYRFEDKAVPYLDAMRAAGLEPVCITPGNPIGLDGLDGLILSGGADVNPALYGQAPHPKTQSPDDARDAMESKLLLDALGRDMPVLAICRGMQLFNVVHGGTLIQHLDTADVHAPKTEHPIAIDGGTRLCAITAADGKPVNSRHHQGVDQPGQGLIVTARAPDGTIEALERPDRRFAVAVQWHPEDRILGDPADLRLFQALGEAIADRRY